MKTVLLGDSWVAWGHLERPLTAILPDEVRSFGFPGATARDVDRRLRADPTMLREASTVVLVVGVNDTVQHRGARAYARHVLQIARFALAAHVRPFVVAVPSYDIDHVPAATFAGLLKRRLLALFDGRNPIARYRRVLRERLASEHLDSAVTVIDPPAFAPADFENPSHLNASGSQRLAAAICQALTTARSPRRQPPPSPSCPPPNSGCRRSSSSPRCRRP